MLGPLTLYRCETEAFGPPFNQSPTCPQVSRRQMQLAIIVVNWHSEAETLRRVAAIRGWETIAPQVLVVDNESTTRSRSALSQILDRGELLCSEINQGYGGGNNRGIERVLERDVQYLLLLNPDAEISERSLTGLIERLDAHPEIAILGPVIREWDHGGARCYAGGRDISRNLATRVPFDGSGAPRTREAQLVEVDYVPGAVFLARREVFQRIGLFDERFFFSGETADLCARARAEGYKSFVDLEVMADHDTCAVARSRRETLYTYYSLRNRMLYVRKHSAGSSVRRLSYWGMVYMLQMGRAVGKGEFGKARAIALALVHGISDRAGNRNASFV